MANYCASIELPRGVNKTFAIWLQLRDNKARTWGVRRILYLGRGIHMPRTYFELLLIAMLFFTLGYASSSYYHHNVARVDNLGPVAPETDLLESIPMQKAPP